MANGCDFTQCNSRRLIATAAAASREDIVTNLKTVGF